MGKAVKSIGKAITGAVKTVGKATGTILKEATNLVGDVLKGVGLDSLGKEVERLGNDINQIVKVITGEYHDDMKRVKAYQQKVTAYGAQVEDSFRSYNSEVDRLADKMQSLIAFHEIFQLALGNRLDMLSAEYSPELAAMNAQYEAMVAELKRMIAKIESEYDFVIGLTQGAFVQRIIGSVIMIIGGLMSDLGDVISGKANSSTFGRIGTAIVTVVIIVVAILNPPAWGTGAATGAMTVVYMVIIGLIILNAFMALDGMYSNGAATGAIMSVLDGIFNDVLNLDDLIGSDFEKFDKDHEDYSQMVGYVQLAITLTTAYLAWGSSSSYYAETSRAVGQTMLPTMDLFGTTSSMQTSAPTFFDQVALAQEATNASRTYLGGSLVVGKSTADSSLFGVTFSTYSDIYKAFSAAMKVKDYVSANKQYEDMKKKFESDKEKLNMVIDSKLNKNMMKHYKDTAYFLQDQQDSIDSYIWSMTARNMYVDPYGTTPVANIRFKPDKDTRTISFGFEDIFDEDSMAGSRNYFNNIIYGG